ncbi:MAG: acetylglutamate kinase [Alphaproteobacteria bacterium]
MSTRGVAASVLTEALPYLRSYVGKPIVVKVSGRVAEDADLLRDFASDLVLARQVGVRPVLVHGGAPQIASQLAREGYESRFRDGLRVTDKEVARVVEMVLSGQVSKRIVSAIDFVGGRAMGISGRDGGLIEARRVGGDLGNVGEVESLRIQALLAIEQAGMIPVVAPVASVGGEILNINADTVAGAIAEAMGAVRLLVVTDVEGLLDARGELVEELSLSRARRLLGSRSTAGGMRPKLEACIAAVEAGVEAAVMLDGRVPHALLLELFTTHGGGTLIRR